MSESPRVLYGVNCIRYRGFRGQIPPRYPKIFEKLRPLGGEFHSLLQPDPYDFTGSLAYMENKYIAGGQGALGVKILCKGIW